MLTPRERAINALIRKQRHIDRKRNDLAVQSARIHAERMSLELGSTAPAAREAYERVFELEHQPAF